ncbi:MAG: flagellar protein FlaG, partial [Leptonema sp. (in: bacteria)]
HVDQDTGKIRIKIYDFLTGEVIQEIPSDKFLDFIKEMKKGIDNEALKKLSLIPTGIFIENEV